jgi:Glycosyltransferase family 87
MPPRLERLSRGFVTVLILGLSIGLTLTFVGVGEALGLVPSAADHDWQAYYFAAERLRHGEPLYPPVDDPGTASVYRYPPWFAVAWIPLTLLPPEVASVIWVSAMFVAGAFALWPLMASGRRPAILLGALFTPFLAQAAIHGNVQPLLVALLIHSVDGRFGPISIGLAASLKGFPIIYAFVYAMRREWRNFAIAVTITAVLAGTLLLADLSNYPLYPGSLAGLWLISPIAWAVGALVAVGAVLWFARTRERWFAASVAVVLSIPRLLYYDMTFLLVTGRELISRPDD